MATENALDAKIERNRKAEAELREIQRKQRVDEAKEATDSRAADLDAENDRLQAAIKQAKALNKVAGPPPAAETDNKPAGSAAAGKGEDK